MKFGQVVTDSKRNIFLQKSNEADRLVPDLSLFFKKALYKVNTSGFSLFAIYFNSPQLCIQ